MESSIQKLIIKIENQTKSMDNLIQQFNGVFKLLNKKIMKNKIHEYQSPIIIAIKSFLIISITIFIIIGIVYLVLQKMNNAPECFNCTIIV